MGPDTRGVCRECLRVTGPEAEAPLPVECPHCGGELAFESDEAESQSDGDTPLSLVLTPESLESTPWVDPIGGGKPAQTGPLTPMCLGRFQLRDFLGGGGFGQVYRAYDPRLDRTVALKVLREQKPSGRVMERFFREARAAAQLDHPNIVALHDAGRDQGRCWIAYQFIGGRTLTRFREEGAAANLRIAVAVIRDLANALEHAHQRGVYHRDVKPSNILIDATGRARLTDFGLARRSRHDATLTIEGAVLGTPAYMSPEQAAGRSHQADARSDIYSLGVVLYEILCGVRPHDLPSEVPLWRAESLTQAPPPPRSRNPRIPAALDRVCHRALAQDPADRYPDARSLAEDLDRWLQSQSGVGRSGPAVAVAIALTTALLGVGLGQAVHFRSDRSHVEASNSPRPQRDASHNPARVDLKGTLPTELLASKTASKPGPFRAGPIGNLYHVADCSGLANVAPSQIRHFPNREAAEAEGRQACGYCARQSPRPTVELRPVLTGLRPASLVQPADSP